MVVSLGDQRALAPPPILTRQGRSLRFGGLRYTLKASGGLPGMLRGDDKGPGQSRPVKHTGGFLENLPLRDGLGRPLDGAVPPWA